MVRTRAVISRRLKFDAIETKKLYFCACKATANRPLCDGSHKPK